jgi:transposase
MTTRPNGFMNLGVSPTQAIRYNFTRESEFAPQMRVLVAIDPVDGRKGIDSLSRLCQDKLAEDPFSGCVFVFRSRSGTAIRLLTYDLC